MIKEIIDLLSNDEKSLTTPLLKTQVFASRIKNEELYNWVTKELDGYNHEEEIPIYRLGKNSPIGTLLVDGYIYHENQTLPLSVFGEKVANMLVKFKIDNGVKAIEDIASGKHGDIIVKPFGADFCQMLTKNAHNNGARFDVITARVEVHINEFTNVLSKIRSKLLGLILKVEQQFPDIDANLATSENKQTEVSETVTKIMTQINITSSGQGNIITAGDNNEIHAKISVSKGDLNALRNELEKVNVPVEDIEEITQIIQVEQPNDGTLGLRAKSWISNMFNKAMDGTWDVSVAVAGGVLVEVLKKFYGLG